MSPSETSSLPGYLEHPAEAFKYYQSMGLDKVICEEKHMGSRAIAVLCKDQGAALMHFGLKNDGIGKVYTRTGRNFFNETDLEKAFLNQLQNELSETNFWSKFKTSWICMDCELMPWSVKAQQLLQEQYASVGSAGQAALNDVVTQLRLAAKREIDGVQELVSEFQDK